MSKASAVAIMLFVFLMGHALADTNVGGTISTNTTWTLANSPYIVTSNVIVAGASTPVLTIEAGVLVKVNSGKSIEIGNSTNEGRLKAFGTASSLIRFEANTASPTAGYWTGIIFRQKSGGCASDLVYATIKHAVNGVNRDNSGPCVSWVTFDTNTTGVRNNSWGTSAFLHCSFMGNTNGAVNNGGTIPIRYSWWNHASGLPAPALAQGNP